MTLRMLDSIYAGNLPAGADAYLGYVDGNWADFQAEVAKFPHAHVLSMAVFPRDDAAGCDREPGDLALGDIAVWVKRQIAHGAWRPVVYASVSGMDFCIQALRVAGVALPAVRLLTAHYGAGKHICGPATCKLVTVAVDGTQWRDNAPGVGGSLVDESVLRDDFFGAHPAPKPPSPPPPPAKGTIVPSVPGTWKYPPVLTLTAAGFTLTGIGENLGFYTVEATVNPDGSLKWGAEREITGPVSVKP